MGVISGRTLKSKDRDKAMKRGNTGKEVAYICLGAEKGLDKNPGKKEK